VIENSLHDLRSMSDPFSRSVANAVTYFLTTERL
jgi:hypothetical protein